MLPINVMDYEALARAHMESGAWDYYQGGSEDEITLRASRSAFERICLRPRVLVDVNTIDMGTTVLGTAVSMPVLVAPTAFHGLADPQGECLTVQGVGQTGTLMTVSTAATRSLEEIAHVASGPLWFQLYVRHNLKASETLVRRAQAAGYLAIVLTVDTPVLGKRERDLRNDFSMPSHAFSANFDHVPKERILEVFVPTWETVDWLRSWTSLPILLKGILTAEDALLAIGHNVAGIVVSNHGGRQLDGVQASIEALPEVVEAVAGRCEVFVDGGIRRGTDVLKALALGARAVLVGRPILWGLAANGQEGVRHVLELLRTELEVAMKLAGCPTLASIDRTLVKL